MEYLGGANPRNWDPSRRNAEVMHHVDRAHERLEREMNLRFGHHVRWCQPAVRSYNQIRFYVPEIDENRAHPTRREGELAVDYVDGHIERNEPSFSLDFVTQEGHMVARIVFYNNTGPILNEVVGDSSIIGFFRVWYYWRGNNPTNSMTHAMLDA